MPQENHGKICIKLENFMAQMILTVKMTMQIGRI